MKSNSYLVTNKIKILYFLTVLSLLSVALLVIWNVVLTKEYLSLRDKPTVISNAIISAVDGLNKDVETDAQTGIGYIHEAHFQLPVGADITASQFKYAYQQAQEEGEFPEMVSVAYKPAIEQSKVAVFSAETVEDSLAYVPELQACARGYAIYFSLQTEKESELMFEKTLKDGRRIFVYKESACIEDNHEDIVSYLQLLESY